MTDSSNLAAAYKSACLTELETLKPGNVHIFADGHGMVLGDFIRSAEASAPVIAETGRSVGQRILSAVEASWRATRCNTNLGIILLCAPVIHAVLTAKHGLRQDLIEVLRGLTIDDATLAFRAIVMASPAGLGQGMEHDVHALPSVTLLEAMQQAQARDLIARQYTNGYADIFDFGVQRYHECVSRWQHETWAVSAVYLGFLARFPDSHIVRKYGQAIALAVQHEAITHDQALLESDNPKNCQREMLRFDADLKRRGLNPGTSADVTVATVLIACLMAADVTAPS